MSGACVQEPHVRRAATEDLWTTPLRAHVETCADCRAAAAVAPVMASVARVDEQPVLPSPTVIWVKAQLARRGARLERVTRPIHLMQIFAYLAVAGGWAAVLMLKWADIERLLLSPAAAFTGSVSISMTLVMGVVLLGSITLAVAMHTILAEE